MEDIFRTVQSFVCYPDGFPGNVVPAFQVIDHLTDHRLLTFVTGMSKTRRGIFFTGSKSVSMISLINKRTDRGGKRLYGYRKNG